MRGLRSAVIVVLSLGLLLCGGEAAIADTTTEFDLQGFTSTVVDTTNSHVIVSGSSPNSSVAVFGYTGALVKRLTGETDAGGMVIVGSTLYIANCPDSAASSIAMVDLGTLTSIGSVAIPPGISSYYCQLGYAGGRIWFTTPGAEADLASMSTSAAHTVTTYPSIACCYRYGDYSASRPNQLVAVDTQFGYAQVYDVSGATPVVAGTLSSYGEDIAVSADGASGYSAMAYTTDDIHRYSLPGFTETGSYGGGQISWVSAIEISSTGRVAAAIGSQVEIISGAGKPPNRAYVVPNLRSVSIAFSGDGSKVFAVGYDYDTQKSTFNVLTNLSAIQSTLTAVPDVHQQTWVDSAVPFLGWLQRSDGSAAGGQTVKLYGSLDGAPFTLLHSTTTAADGSFEIDEAPDQAGQWQFEARYAGDATHVAATSDLSYLFVERRLTTLVITSPDSETTTHPGETVTVAGDLSDYLGQPIAGATVHLADESVDPYNPTPLVDVTTDANGHFSVDAVPRNDQWWTVIATYDGDRVNDSARDVQLHGVYPDSPQITLTPSAGSVVFGHVVTLTAHLTNHHTNATVTVSRIVAGIPDTVATGDVDADGNLRVALSIGTTTTFRVDYAGDDWTVPGSSTVRVIALPIITGVLSRPAARSGVYNLYHYNLTCVRYHARGCPLFAIHVAPNQSGRIAYMVIQIKTRSGWKSVVSYRRRLSSLSRATFPIAYTSTAVIGKYYRIAALTPGHPDLGAVAYGYWHFRIIR